MRDANSNRLNNGTTYDNQDWLISTGTASYTANGEPLTTSKIKMRARFQKA